MSKNVRSEKIREGEELPCHESNIISTREIQYKFGRKGLKIWYVETQDNNV